MEFYLFYPALVMTHFHSNKSHISILTGESKKKTDLYKTPNVKYNVMRTYLKWYVVFFLVLLYLSVEKMWH